MECLERGNFLPGSGIHRFRLIDAYVRSVRHYVDVHKRFRAVGHHTLLLARECVECGRNQRIFNRVELHNGVRATSCGTHSEFACQRFAQRIKGPDSQLECLERRDELSRSGLHEFGVYHARIRSVGYHLHIHNCQRARRPDVALLARERDRLRRDKRMVSRLELQNTQELML